MRIIDQLVYKISGDTNEFNNAINSSEKKISTFGTTAKKIFTGIGITAAIKAITDQVIKSVDAFSSYEEGLAKVSTLFGDVEVDMDNLSDGVQRVSSETGLLANEINEALYSALSAGVEVTEDMSTALDLVESSGKLARAGFTDTDTALSATIKTINAYKLGLDQTDRIQNILMQTQNKGITTVGELGQNLAKVTPTAAAFGVTFEDVGASIATMTAQGIKTEMATTYLSGVISELGKQGTSASVALATAAESLGMTETSMKGMLDSGMSLGDVLNIMSDYAKETGISVVDMFGSLEAGKAVLALTGENAETFSNNLDSMYNSAGLVEDGFTKMADTVKGQTDKLKANINSLSVNLGKALLPAVNSIIGGLVSLSEKMIANNSATADLDIATEDLNTQSEEYKRIMGELLDPTRNLTDAERVRLEILRDIQAQNVADTTNKVATAFKKTKKDIEENNAKLNELIITEQAYTSVMLDISTAQARYNELYKNKKRTDEEQIEFMKLGQALLDTEAQRRTVLFSLEGKIDTQRRESIALNNGLNTSMQSIISSVADGIISVDQYALTNKEFYDTVMNGVSILEDQRAAQKEFNKYTNASIGELNTLIDSLESAGSQYGLNEYSLELLRLAKAKLAEMTGTVTEAVNTETTAVEDETEAIRDATNALDEFNRRTKERADAIKEMAESRMSDHEKAIAEIHEQAEEWLRAGVNRTDVATWVSEQIQKLIDEESAKKQAEKDAESKRQEEETAKLEQEEANRKKIREDAYAEIERSRMDEYQLAVDNIEKQTQAYITAGVSEVDAEKWKSEQIAILDKKLADEKQKLADEEQARLDEETRKTQEALDAQNKATLEAFNERTRIRSEAYDKINESRMSDHEKDIKSIHDQGEAFLKAGVDRADVAEWVSEQIQKLIDEESQKVKEALDTQNKAIQDAYNLRTQTLADAYREIDWYRMSDHEKAIQSIRNQAEAWLKAGVDRTDVAEWVSDEIQDLMEEEADKAEKEAERAKQAWIDYGTSIVGYMSSTWDAINTIQSNAHASELARMESEGASEEEINEKKKQFAIDDAKRRKAINTFQAIIDTSSAIIGFLANPGGLLGAGLSVAAGVTGAAQIAAIQSQPLPSFDVGSIRIPETTQAIVHKDEMILTAPQAEQARREGITISPNGNTSAPIHLVVNLNGRAIIDETVKGINSGQYGKIDTRITK